MWSANSDLEKNAPDPPTVIRGKWSTKPLFLLQQFSSIRVCVSWLLEYGKVCILLRHLTVQLYTLQLFPRNSTLTISSNKCAPNLCGLWVSFDPMTQHRDLHRDLHRDIAVHAAVTVPVTNTLSQIDCVAQVNWMES